MEESHYRKLGTRTLIYAIVARSRIAAIVLFLTLLLVLVKNFSASSATVSNSAGFLDSFILWGFLTAFAAFVVTFFISWLEYTMFQLSLGVDIFKIRRGVFTKEEIAIPYRRIESVDIRRTLAHQLFGVSRINIETTIDSQSTEEDNGDASDEVLPVIDYALARTIQEELTKRANVQKMRV